MLKILIVDDDNIAHVMTKRLLGGTYSLAAAYSGEEALAYLAECVRTKSELPSLILMDIRMEGVSGSEVYRRMRSDEALREIPVIFITADSDPETQERCLADGAIDVILKPFVPRVLLNRVNNAIELSAYRNRG